MRFLLSIESAKMSTKHANTQTHSTESHTHTTQLLAPSQTQHIVLISVLLHNVMDKNIQMIK